MTQADGQQREIRLDSVFDALRQPLGLIDNPDRRADIERYVESARIFLERAMFDVISDAVAAFNEAGGGRARLEYRGGTLYLVVEPTAEESAGEPEATFNIEGDMEKVTIRIPRELKDLIDRAAGGRGVSINSWYIRELARVISRQVRDQARTDYHEARREYREARREERSERHQGGGGSLHGFVGKD